MMGFVVTDNKRVLLCLGGAVLCGSAPNVSRVCWDGGFWSLLLGSHLPLSLGLSLGCLVGVPFSTCRLLSSAKDLTQGWHGPVCFNVPVGGSVSSCPPTVLCKRHFPCRCSQCYLTAGIFSPFIIKCVNSLQREIPQVFELASKPLKTFGKNWIN